MIAIISRQIVATASLAFACWTILVSGADEMPGLNCLTIYPPGHFTCHPGPTSTDPPIGFTASDFKDTLFNGGSTDQVPDACLTLNHYTNGPEDLPRNAKNNPTFRIGTFHDLQPLGDITIGGWTNSKGVWAVCYFKLSIGQNYPYPCDCEK